MGRKADGKPRGRMSAYAYFVQTCREEHKKKHPGESVVFAEFSKKCAEKWKLMSVKEKQRFQEMSEKDKIRYDREMDAYVPPEGQTKKRRKQTKDPNAPKRALSAFFMFCNEERTHVKAAFPTYGVADVAKELGRRWEKCPDRTPFDALAAKDKLRYQKAMTAYKETGAAPTPAKKAKVAAPPPPPKKEESEEEEDEEEEGSEEEEEESD